MWFEKAEEKAHFYASQFYLGQLAQQNLSKDTNLLEKARVRRQALSWFEKSASGSNLLSSESQQAIQSIKEQKKALSICASCAKEDANKICGGCNSVRYCSLECQKKHWRKTHKSECKKGKNLA